MPKKGGGLATELTQNVKQGFNEVQPPNIILWGFMPALLTFIFCVSFIYALDIKLIGKSKKTTCTGTGKNEQCRETTVSHNWKLFAAIPILIFLPIAIGYVFMQLGLIVLNPKLGVGILATGMFVDALD
jgi:hypothetical protein